MRDALPKSAIPRARQLRRAMTDAETKLWKLLRGRRMLALKFRRQVPVGPYIADFLCIAAKVIVEADGSQHADSARDLRRDAFLAGQGYRVLRFWNIDINTALDGAVLKIEEALKEAPSGAPRHLPRKGGG